VVLCRTFRENQRKIIIVTAYHVCLQKAAIGSNMVYNHQFNILLHCGQSNPIPCQQIRINIIGQINKWTNQPKEVLLCIDLNESSLDTNPDKGIGYLLSNTTLKDLHRHQFLHLMPPPTHIRGQLTIDVCLGTQLFIDSLVRVWYPFGLPATIPGDHRALGLDFELYKIFGNKIPKPDQPPS